MTNGPEKFKKWSGKRSGLSLKVLIFTITAACPHWKRKAEVRSVLFLCLVLCAIPDSPVIQKTVLYHLYVSWIYHYCGYIHNRWTFTITGPLTGHYYTRLDVVRNQHYYYLWLWEGIRNISSGSVDCLVKAKTVQGYSWLVISSVERLRPSFGIN